MNKDDVKAIIIIFLILLLISAVGLLGLNIYLTITNRDVNDLWMAYEGNVTITPDEDKVTDTDNEGNSVLNQILSAESQNQSANPNTPTIKEQYYYKQINSYAKIIYDKLKENKENLKSGTYKLDFGKEFNDLLQQENGSDLLQEYYQSAIETYLYDNPDVFYIDPTKMYLNIQTTKKLFTTTYEVYLDCGENSNYLAEGYFSKEQILNYENKIKQATQEILSKASGKSDYDKILIIHDYLVENVSYEETISKNNIFNIYGTLVNKESVCEGYAKAFKYLMDQVGVKTIVVIGTATDSKGNSQNHAWNYVNLNNEWYAIDATWDDPIIIGGGWLTKKSKYKYFLKGSITMAKDHNESYSFIENGTVYQLPSLSVRDYE